MCVCVECMCHVCCMCVRVSMTVQLRDAAIWTRLVRSAPIVEDSKLCSLWTRYTGDSKTDTRVDSEIRTGSCSTDQTAIPARNCVISYEYLFLHYCYLPLSVNVLYVFIRLHYCFIIILFRYCLYMLSIVHDHAQFDDIYIHQSSSV